MKIMLDAGHYTGYNSFVAGLGNEGTNNWEVVVALKKELEKYGFTVGLTKSSANANPTLSARGRAAKGYDLFWSIHSNAGGGTGTEIFDDTNPKYSNKKLADIATRTISQSLGLPNRGTKYRKNNSGSNYYGVLRNQYAKNGMIIEMFFHDNVKDVQAFRANKDKMIKDLAKALADYYGINKKEEEKQEEVVEKEIVEELPQQHEWSKDAVDWAIENDISDGLRLYDSLTREEAITMIYRVIMGK